MLTLLIDGLSDLIYPPNCLLCHAYLRPSQHLHADKTIGKSRRIFQYLNTLKLNPLLCPGCRDSIPFNIPPFCLRCSRHVGATFQYPLCKICARVTHHFDFAWSACLYNDTLKALIHRFKYGQKTLLQHSFSQLMLSFIQEYHFDIEHFDMVVPIPLSATRLRERGYNQAWLLAKGVTSAYPIALDSRLLIRVRHTPNQAQLHEKERWTNIQGAFKIKNSKRVAGKNILIVDDLLTTGATASEAARVLKEAGAKRVGVLTLATTPSGH